MFGFFVSVIFSAWVNAGLAPHSEAIMRVAPALSRSRRTELIGLSTSRIVSTSITCRCLGLRSKDGLDSAALVHGAVTFRNLIQRGVKVEDLAGMDLSVHF